MAQGTPFEELLRRVRSADQAAAAELVRRYEPALRRAVRVRLADARLGALLDSVDICQSVLGSFFVRMTAGQYDIQTPQELLRLLTHMARNKLVSQARRERAERRDHRRVRGGSLHLQGLATPVEDPSRKLEAQELWQAVYQKLSPDERKLVDLRGEGQSWAAIAQEVGGNPVLLRKKLSRALDRVSQLLGVDDKFGG
jgi:RNA polymerase sigma-70 factor (ECF subfamily)